ncbi:MAG: hypothetical protein WDW36_009935 [Sanguina aurantia]
MDATGDVVSGVVQAVKAFGAFVDIGGATGLLHISQISHMRITDVGKILAVGDKLKIGSGSRGSCAGHTRTTPFPVGTGAPRPHPTPHARRSPRHAQVMILKTDQERGCMMLSTKKFEREPGDMVRDPQLVFDGAEEMAQLFMERLARINLAQLELEDTFMGSAEFSMDGLLDSMDWREVTPLAAAMAGNSIANMRASASAGQALGLKDLDEQLGPSQGRGARTRQRALLQGRGTQEERSSRSVGTKWISNSVVAEALSGVRAARGRLTMMAAPLLRSLGPRPGTVMIVHPCTATAPTWGLSPVGDVVTGIVQSVLPYGAFVDLGGVTGLLHVSQISHARVDNLTKILSEGDKLKVGGRAREARAAASMVVMPARVGMTTTQVMIISADAEWQRISLSTKKLEKSPGDMVRDPQLVFDSADEMAKLFKERLEGITRGGQRSDRKQGPLQRGGTQTGEAAAGKDAAVKSKQAGAGSAASGNYLQVSEGRFLDDRWVGGRWVLSEFKMADGEMNWDLVIDAEMARRKLLEDLPIPSTNEEPVLFDTSEIPWWAWIKRFHLPEAEKLNGRAAMMGYVLAGGVDLLTGTGLVDQQESFFGKVLLHITVFGILLIRNNSDLDKFKNLIDEATFYDRQWSASWDGVKRPSETQK